MDVTANTAGGREIVERWAVAMARETRMQAQLTYIGKLESRGLTALSDETAAAR